MPEEVFISYGSADRERIQDLISRLRQAGVTVWIDEAGIEGELIGKINIFEHSESDPMLDRF